MEPRRWDEKPAVGDGVALRYIRHPRACELLKAARIRRGVTRRELDREREAVRRFLADGHVARGFTGGQLHALAQEIAKAMTI